MSRLSLNLLVPASLVVLFLGLWGTGYGVLPWLFRTAQNVTGRLASWLRAHARYGKAFGRLEAHRSYLPLVVAFALGTALIAVAANTFFEIASALAAHDAGVQRIDAAVHDWFALHRTPFLNALFVGITTAGGGLGLAAIVVVTVAIGTARKRIRQATYLAITATGGLLLNQLLKAHFVRQRPDVTVAVLGVDGYSFPSGHAMGGTFVLCALGYLAARAMPTWKGKSAAFAALTTLDLSIATSRLYLGVHWASDVVAGLAAGLLWVTATTSGYELFRQYPLRDARERALAATAEPGADPPA